MKPAKDQPPMSKSVVKRLQAQGAEPVATKPVQVCVKCGHHDVAEDGTCAELLLGKQPLAGMVYCGCHCVFPVPEVGGESDWFRLDAILSGGQKFSAYHHPIHNPFKLYINGEVREIETRWNIYTRASQPLPTPTDELFAFDETAQAIAALHTNRELRSICHEQIVRALRDVKNAMTRTTPTDEVNRQAKQMLKMIEDCVKGMAQPLPLNATATSLSVYAHQALTAIATLRRHFTTDVEQEGKTDD